MAFHGKSVARGGPIIMTLFLLLILVIPVIIIIIIIIIIIDLLNLFYETVSEILSKWNV